MSKIRLNRILEGFTTPVSKESEARADVCKNCPLRSKGLLGISFCKDCGCVISEKVTSKNECCPQNKWADIKKIMKKGIVVKNLDTDRLTLVEQEDGVLFTFKEIIPLNGDGKIHLRILNDRGYTAGQFKAKDLDLTYINVRSTCGCTTTTDYPKTLVEGKDFDLMIEYDTKRIGQFEKIVTFTSEQETFYIKFKGEVKK